MVKSLAEKWGPDKLNSYEIEFGKCLSNLQVSRILVVVFILGLTKVRSLGL